MPTLTLRATPNPFSHLDHEGQPAGTFPFDPDHALGARRWVGARIDLSPAPDGKPKTRAIAQPWDLTAKGMVGGRMTSVRVGSTPDQRTVYAFDLSTAGQPLPDSEHYARGVRHGDIIAADQTTAVRCSVKLVEMSTALRAAAAKAIAQWIAEQGEPPPVEAWPEALRTIGVAALEDLATIKADAIARAEQARIDADAARTASEEAANTTANEVNATAKMPASASIPEPVETTAAPAATTAGASS